MAKIKRGLILLLVWGVLGVWVYWGDRSNFVTWFLGLGIFLIFVYLGLDSFILFFLGAKEEKDLGVLQVLGSLGEKAGTRIPKIYITNSLKPKIFSFEGKICFTSGLKNTLTKAELESLFLREIFFIKNKTAGFVHSWSESFAADAFATNTLADPESVISAIEKVGSQSVFEPPIKERIKILQEM